MAPSNDDIILRNSKTELLEAIKKLPSRTEDLSSRREDFEDLVRKWTSSARDVPTHTGEFLYLLNKSSNTDLSAEGLIEADLARFRYLQSLESRCRFNVFIVQLEKKELVTIYGDCAHACFERDESEDEDDIDSDPGNIIEIDDLDWTLRIALFDGTPLRKPYNLGVDPHAMIEGNVFEGYDPDEDERVYRSYGGDEYEDMYQFARYYKSSALLMVPQATTVTYFTQNSKARDDYTAADLLEYFSSKCARSGGDDGFLNTLTSLCKLFFPPKGVKSNSRMDIPEPSIVKILDAAIICQSQYLFDLICNNNEANLSPKFFLWVLARLRGSSMLPFTTLISALDRSIFALKTLDEQYSFIMGLNDLSGRLPNELEAHVLGLFDKMVSLCYTSSLCEKDGQVLVWIACRRDYDWLLKTLGPLMYKNCENAAFTLGFCWEFYVKATRNELRVPDSFAWLKTIVKSLVVRLDVNHLVSVGGFRCWQQNQAAHGGKDGNIIPPPPPPPVTSQTLINLCILLLDLNMEEDLRDLARKLTNQSGRIVPFELLNLYIPFAGGLMDVLENRSVSPLDPVLSSLVRTIVVVFWNQYALPGQPIWRGPRCKVYLDPCGCRVCTLMKDNLHNPKLDNWVIKESEKMAQRHIGMVIANCCSRSHISFTSQTNGKGVMTWYIRKVPTEYDKAKSEWDNRMASFRAQLAKFNQRKLLQVLGNEADYFCITGNDPSCFKTPQINATMVAPSTTAQAPPLARTPGHSEAMSQAALLPPGNLRGGTSSHQDLQPLVHDGLPSMTETSQIPIFEDQPSCSLANHGLPQQPPVINAWRSGMPPPAAHPGVPAQIPTLGSVHEQGRMVQMNQQGQIPHSQFPPGRPPLASFHQNLAWSSGPKLGQNGEASAGAGLKRERDDDDLLFLGERPVKK